MFVTDSHVAIISSWTGTRTSPISRGIMRDRRSGQELFTSVEHGEVCPWLCRVDTEPYAVYRLYHAARLRWNSIERRRGPLEDSLIDDVTQWSMWSFATG